MGGLNATGRGQWRPIWQLFINHYENRMGIPMNFCRTMKGIIGMERGGGSYGNNSGGYDHTGFGDLMYSDRPVTAEQTPTILFPVIAGKTETRKYAEIRDVEPCRLLYPRGRAIRENGHGMTGRPDSNGRSRLNIPEYIVLRTRIPME